MSAQIQSIAEWMSVVIRLTGPCIRPDVAYVQASGMSPIQSQEANGNDSMREFQVQSGPIVEMGAFIGPCYEQWREMDVVMRYVFDERQGDEWREVDRMAADDFDRINLALPRPPLEAPWSSAGVWNIQFSKHDKLAKSARIKGVWEQTLTFRVLYSVTDLVQDWTYVVGYNTLTALKAALSGRPAGTTARLTNARTSELIGTWKKEAGGIKACPPVNFAKADGTEFADGVDIISQGAGSWSITYGTGIVVVDDAAEFYGYGETDNSDILGTGTHATYGRDEIQTYTNQADIDLVTGAADQIVALVGIDGTLTNRQAWNGLVWVRQTRHGFVDSYADQAALEADSPTVDGDCRRLDAQTYPEQYDAGGASWDQLGIPSPSIVNGYTSVTALVDVAGSTGDRAVLIQAPGGKPLIWYRWSKYLSDKLGIEAWVPEEFIFDGLSSAEQTFWDSYLDTAAGYTWTADGLLLNTLGGSLSRWTGLFPAGMDFTAFGANSSAQALVFDPTNGDGGTARVSVILGSGATKNAGWGIGATLEATLVREAAAAKNSGVYQFQGGILTAAYGGTLPYTGTVCWGQGAPGQAVAENMQGGIRTADGGISGVLWSDGGNKSIGNAGDPDLYGIDLLWEESGGTAGNQKTATIRRVRMPWSFD